MTTLKLSNKMRVIPMGGGVSISHGTLRPQDLLRAFATALEERGEVDHALVNEARENAKILDSGLAKEIDYEIAGDVISDLAERLNDLAPEGQFFGAHEGDGSDFGFWPCSTE